MKKLFTFLAISAAIISCDEIEDPLKKTGTSCGVCDVQPTETFITKKAVLIEEFTGITCNNCPKAATEAQRLLTAYPDQVQLISIHAGNFAVPFPPDYPDDLRTEEGTEIYDFAEPLGLPAGVIDRGDYGKVTFNKPYGVWDTYISDILAATPVAAIGIKAEVDSDQSTRTVCVTPKFKGIDDLSGRNLYWAAFLVEDGVVATQKMPDGSKNSNYVQNHVLRTGFNTAFGTPIENFDGLPNSVSCDSRQIVLDPDWKWEECGIVLYVYDRDTYEVFQAIEVHL